MVVWNGQLAMPNRAILVVLLAVLIISGTLYWLASGPLSERYQQAPWNQVPFDSLAWTKEVGGNHIGSGAYRLQMQADACRWINGRSLTSVLIGLGPPDWIGKKTDIKQIGRGAGKLQGACILGYFLEPSQESSLCISLYEDSRIERCFITVWNDEVVQPKKYPEH